MKKSDLISWSPSLSVGIKVIDDQHKGLLRITNDLFNHSTGDEASERAYFNKVIHSIVDYVKVHFGTEERLLAAARFPAYAKHKQEHDMFVLTVADMARDFHERKKNNLSAFTHFLKDWILTHIAVSDRQYFEYFKRLATRKADGSLSITRGDLEKGTAAKTA